MDARRAALAGVLVTLVANAGCALFGPTASPAPAPQPPAQPVADVSAPDDGATAPELAPVEQYLAMIERAAQAAELPPAVDAPPVSDYHEPPVIEIAPPPAEPVAAPVMVNATATPEVTPVAAPEQPPVLAGISVNGAGSRIEVAPAGASAGANAAAVAAAVPPSFEEVLNRYFSRAEDDSFRAQYDMRMARLLAGDYEGAREPLELVTEEQQNLARGLIEAQIAVREAHLGNWPDGAARATEQLTPLLVRLSEASDLAIPKLVLCQRVAAFGNYTPIEPAEFVTGQPVAFATYCELRNLVSRAGADGTYTSRLAMTTAVITRAGDTILELQDADIVDQCRNRRSDFFIAREVRLPATLAPGEYVVKVTVTDKLGQKVAEQRTTFRVVIR